MNPQQILPKSLKTTSELLYLILTPHIDDDSAAGLFAEFRQRLRNDPETMAVFSCFDIDNSTGTAELIWDAEAWSEDLWNATLLYVDFNQPVEEAEPVEPSDINEVFQETNAAPPSSGLFRTGFPAPDTANVWDTAAKMLMPFGKYGPKRPNGPLTVYDAFMEDSSYFEWALRTVDRLSPRLRQVMELMVAAGGPPNQD